MNIEPSINWLFDPEVFAIGRLEAFSDHIVYPDFHSALEGERSAFREYLDGQWSFNYVEDLSSRPVRFHEVGFDFSSWDKITVPGHIQLQGYGKIHYTNVPYPWDGLEAVSPPQVPERNSVGSYIREFEFGELSENESVVLTFEGVDTAFFVWLNGIFIGYSEDSFTPAHFDVTAALRSGSNRIAVEVFQRSTASWLEDQDFWRFSGIFRSVYLERQSESHIRDLHVTTELDDEFKEGKLNFKLAFSSLRDGTQVSVRLSDPGGHIVAEADYQRVSTVFQEAIVLKSPRLWSAEQPNLYTLFLELRSDEGELISITPQKVGFRRFELRNRLMLLNGKRIVFCGVNRHEFNPRLGRAITKDDMLWDIRFMKQSNINAVRTSHYPNQSDWYRLCDEYGIYVIDEANLETHGSWRRMKEQDQEGALPGDKAEWRASVLDRAKSMFERDKNHPSVLIWSCGNESYGGSVIFEMSEYLRHRDPTRLVHYQGIFEDRRYNATSDMESQMYTKPQDVAAYLDMHHEKPFIMCEYMHAMGNSCGGMRLYQDLTDRYPLYQGGFIWDFVDQAIAVPDHNGVEQLRYGGYFGDRPSDFEFSGNGIVSAWRQAYPKAQDVKAVYQSYVVRPYQNGVEITNKNLFVNTSGLLLSYKILRNGTVIHSGHQEVAIEAGRSKEISLSLPDFTREGEYCLQCALVLRDKTIWAEAGHEVAFGEYLWSSEVLEERNAEHTDQKVVLGKHNLGFSIGRTNYLVSQRQGGLVSIRFAEREWLLRPPRFTFWRATTDNDRGNHHGYHHAIWHMATLYQRLSMVSFDDNSSHPTATCRFDFPGINSPGIICYSLADDNKLHISAEFAGEEGLPDIPLFGLEFELDSSIDRMRYYGLGPDENYRDRAEGARFGVFSSHVKDNLSPYLVPQECGNRMGVRWLEALDANGFGLRFDANSDPFEFSLLEYSSIELQAAKYKDDLPPVSKTVLRLLSDQMGIGGDDSMGAPVQRQFLLPSDLPRMLSFTVTQA